MTYFFNLTLNTNQRNNQITILLQPSIVVLDLSPLMPVQPSTAPMVMLSSVPSSQLQQSSADKYSALADLESVFSATSLSGFSISGAGNGVNWDAVSRSSASSVGQCWGQPAVGIPESGVSEMAPFAGGNVSGYSSSPPPPSYAAAAAGILYLKEDFNNVTEVNCFMKTYLHERS